jgi:D-glycero-alpha-D-manno-heptose-7-phosphate kinase
LPCSERSSTSTPAPSIVETTRLGRQSGIQDQICSALGGVNDIVMTAYPDADVRALPVSPALQRELERRLSVVFLGGGHSSSALHERVIARLEGLGPDCPELQVMRVCAADAAAAVTAGDLAGLGRAMTANTEAQRRLHDDLVCADADRVVAIARAHGAAGWKVNGAGGEGGSLTILCGGRSYEKRAMIKAIEGTGPSFRSIPIYLSRQGLRVWERP